MSGPNSNAFHSVLSSFIYFTLYKVDDWQTKTAMFVEPCCYHDKLMVLLAMWWVRSMFYKQAPQAFRIAWLLEGTQFTLGMNTSIPKTIPHLVLRWWSWRKLSDMSVCKRSLVCMFISPGSLWIIILSFNDEKNFTVGLLSGFCEGLNIWVTCVTHQTFTMLWFSLGFCFFHMSSIS